jgi:acetaldehyde dehydrogenase (acetylating)
MSTDRPLQTLYSAHDQEKNGLQPTALFARVDSRGAMPLVFFLYRIPAHSMNVGDARPPGGQVPLPAVLLIISEYSHMANRLKIAILGTGNIGTDLLVKVQRSPFLECSLFSGRNLSSPGMQKAIKMGVPLSTQGIQAIVDDPSCCDLVFDCTSALGHLEHAPILRSLDKICIDLTPSKMGEMCVPAINLESCLAQRELNMITCGGQVSTPLAYAIGRVHDDVEYIEVVSSIASRSAGPATRLNLDEYIDTTQRGVECFSGAKRTKAILILNPAEPCIHMQTTVFAKVANPRMDELKAAVTDIAARIRSYVPGYRMLVDPVLEGGRIVITARVSGLGDYLPEYAGNLDIINCAALAAAEGYAKAQMPSTVVKMGARHG